MNVQEFLSDSKMLEMMTGGELATENVELSSILLFDGPSVNLKFNVLSLPKKHPDKWKKMGCNAYTYILSQSVDIDINILKWKSRINCALVLKKTESGVRLQVLEDGKPFFECSSRFLVLDRIEGYIDERIS